MHNSQSTKRIGCMWIDMCVGFHTRLCDMDSWQLRLCHTGLWQCRSCNMLRDCTHREAGTLLCARRDGR